MKSFDVIVDGKRYCGMQELSQRNDYATIWSTIWAGQPDVHKFVVTPTTIFLDGCDFWNCIFENKSDGSPTQLTLDLEK